MKRVLIVIMLVLLLPICATAQIDLREMTTEQLLSLKAAIAQELMLRNEIGEVLVPPGQYIVGEDIPAGNYTVYASSAVAVLTKNSYEESYYLEKGNHIGKLVLQNGDTVEITNGCIFTIYKGLEF